MLVHRRTSFLCLLFFPFYISSINPIKMKWSLAMDVIENQSFFDGFSKARPRYVYIFFARRSVSSIYQACDSLTRSILIFQSRIPISINEQVTYSRERNLDLVTTSSSLLLRLRTLYGILSFKKQRKRKKENLVEGKQTSLCSFDVAALSRFTALA